MNIRFCWVARNSEQKLIFISSVWTSGTVLRTFRVIQAGGDLFLKVALHCIQWWGALDLLGLRAARFVRVCSTTGYNTSGIRGLSPQALTHFRGVGFITRCLRRPEKGNTDGARGIFGTACHVGFRPSDRTHLKNGLVPHSYAGGA